MAAACPHVIRILFATYASACGLAAAAHRAAALSAGSIQDPCKSGRGVGGVVGWHDTRCRGLTLRSHMWQQRCMSCRGLRRFRCKSCSSASSPCLNRVSCSSHGLPADTRRLQTESVSYGSRLQFARWHPELFHFIRRPLTLRWHYTQCSGASSKGGRVSTTLSCRATQHRVYFDAQVASRIRVSRPTLRGAGLLAVPDLRASQGGAANRG
jgi:hypothetical protein